MKNILFLIIVIVLISCLPIEEKKIKSKISLVEIYENQNNENVKSGFKFCLEDAIKHPYSKNIDFYVKFSNGKEVKSIYKKILSPSTRKALVGEDCFIVDVKLETVHRRHRKEKDVEILRILNKMWYKDSIESIEIVVYKNTYSESIYDKQKFSSKSSK